MPSITCPCCQSSSPNPDDIANGYCGRCHWWTSDPGMAPYHFALPCDHRGLGVIMPRLGAYFCETQIIYRHDDGSGLLYPMPQFELECGEPWLYTSPGTMIELAGTMRRKPLPWWRRLSWRRQIERIRTTLKRTA